MLIRIGHYTAVLPHFLYLRSGLDLSASEENNALSMTHISGNKFIKVSMELQQFHTLNYAVYYVCNTFVIQCEKK